MQHSNQPVLRADYEHGPRCTVTLPVHRPTIFFLEIVERAFENKNREGFIDRWRKGWGWGKEKIDGRSFLFFLALHPCSRASSSLSRPRFTRVLVDFRKEKETASAYSLTVTPLLSTIIGSILSRTS